MIQIDGSYLEGGGQIVRTALALSTVLQKPVTVTNIRKGRPTPGLKQQHINCIKALQQLCNAKVEGVSLGSERITYVPQPIKKSKIKVDVGTAGSITLLLQSLLLPALLSEKKTTIEITGGTDVQWAMQIDYFREVVIPIYAQYAESIEVTTKKRGYYPKGNGTVIVIVTPHYTIDTISQAPQLNVTQQGTLQHIKGVSHASQDLQATHVAERQAQAAKIALTHLGVPVQIDTEYAKTDSPGAGITLWAVCSTEKKDLGYKEPVRIGADMLGKKGKLAEVIGEEAAQHLMKELESQTGTDNHAADNIVPLLGFVN